MKEIRLSYEIIILISGGFLGLMFALGIIKTGEYLSDLNNSPNINNYKDCFNYVYSDLNQHTDSRDLQTRACKVVFPEED
jgi:hypothetical protein